jgi:signal transduction histidine kinase
MAYNITRRKLAEDDMRRALTKEKELSRLRSQFVSMTSHEFRTPLASILTSSELLEHYSQRWPHEKNLLHLKRIQSSVQHIVRLMDDVLILGKSDVDRLTPEPVPVNVKELLQSLIEEYVESYKAHIRLSLMIRWTASKLY